MKIYSFFGFLAGLLGLAVTPLFAQPETGVEKKVKVEIRALSAGRGITDLGVIQGGKKTPVYPPSFALSTPFIYEGPPSLVFSQTQLHGDAKAEVPVANVTLPPDVSKVFIVFRPAPLTPGQFEAQVIPNGVVEGDSLSARVINSTKRQIKMRLNGAKHAVRAGESIRVPLLKGKVSVFIPREHKQTEDEADICNETYTVPDGARLTLLVANAASNQSAQDQGVMIIPLVDDAAPVTPAGN